MADDGQITAQASSIQHVCDLAGFAKVLTVQEGLMRKIDGPRQMFPS